MEVAWQWLATQIQGNEMFAGLVSATFLGGLMVWARSAPKLLWKAFLHQCTVELTIHNNETAFSWVTYWLAGQAYSGHSRRLKISVGERVDGESAETKAWDVSPGDGLHIFFHRGRPVHMRRESTEIDKIRGNFLPEKITFRTLGRSQKFLRLIIADAEAEQFKNQTTPVFVWSRDYWKKTANKRPRSLSTVFLPQTQLDRIIGDAEWFCGAVEWYLQRGIPHRRGYRLAGPPGTGKTTLVMGLAGHLRMPVYVLSLGAILNDNSLLQAFAEAPARCIILIEDIDVAVVSRPRTEIEQKDVPGISMSGLLNAIDGATSSEGRLLVMTTNHPDQQDPALIRSGRIDMDERIDLLGPEDAGRMFKNFFPEANGEIKEFSDAMSSPMSAADLQGIFLKANEPALAVAAIRDLKK